MSADGDWSAVARVANTFDLLLDLERAARVPSSKDRLRAYRLAIEQAAHELRLALPERAQ